MNFCSTTCELPRKRTACEALDNVVTAHCTVIPNHNTRLHCTNQGVHISFLTITTLYIYLFLSIPCVMSF